MASTTTHWGLPIPGGSDSADGPDGFSDLANALDDVTKYSSGVYASRPTSSPGTPGIEGRFYRATDVGVTTQGGILYYDFGTGWLPASGLRVGHSFTTLSTLGLPAAAESLGAYTVERAGVFVVCRHKLASGTATIKIQKNGVDVTGLTSLSMTTTQTSASFTAVSVAVGDRLSPVVVTQGAGKGFEISLGIDY